MVFLGFLTSEKCRTACSRHARPEFLAAMLTQLWFEEIYVPSETAIDGIRPVPDPEDCRRFNACFSTEELGSLERFHGFFELKLNLLTNQIYGRAFFPENDSWQGILNHAKYLLAELNPDPDWLQSILEALIQNIQNETLKEGLRYPRQLISQNRTPN